LTLRGRENLVLAGCPEGSTDVAPAVRMLKNRPEVRAVVLAATAPAAVQFLRQMKVARPNLEYACLSTVGTLSLARELREAGGNVGSGLIVAQAVPPADGPSVLLDEYRAALKAVAPNEAPGPASLEGYLAARLLIEGLRRAGDVLDADRLVESLESMKELDLGLPLGFKSGEHQATHPVLAGAVTDAGAFRALDLTK